MRRKIAIIGALLAGLILPWLPVIPAHATPSIWYQAHVQNIGWQNQVRDSEIAGTTGQSLRLEAIYVYGLPVEVKAHVQNLGWMDWAAGSPAGTTGESLRLEAIRVRPTEGLDPSLRVECRAHVQNIGWMPWVAENEICGTTGASLRLEAIQLRVI